VEQSTRANLGTIKKAVNANARKALGVVYRALENGNLEAARISHNAFTRMLAHVPEEPEA